MGPIAGMGIFAHRLGAGHRLARRLVHGGGCHSLRARPRSPPGGSDYDGAEHRGWGGGRVLNIGDGEEACRVPVRIVRRHKYDGGGSSATIEGRDNETNIFRYPFRKGQSLNGYFVYEFKK